MLLGLAVSDVDVGVLNMGVKCICSFFLMFPVSRNVYSLMNAIIGAIGLNLLFYIQGSFGKFCPGNLHSNLNFEADFPFFYVFSKTRRLSLYSNIEHEYFTLHIRRKKGLHSATKEMRTIHDHIDRNSKTLIYMIHCLHCNKQHIGETKRRLEDNFDERRRSVDRPTPSSRPTEISDHFLSDNHSPHDRELVPLELIHSYPDALRKAVLLRDKMNLNLE